MFENFGNRTATSHDYLFIISMIKIVPFVALYRDILSHNFHFKHVDQIFFSKHCPSSVFLLFCTLSSTFVYFSDILFPPDMGIPANIFQGGAATKIARLILQFIVGILFELNWYVYMHNFIM